MRRPGGTDVTAIYFALGLAGLFFGGDWLVRGASGIATRYHVSPLVIGLTIVGFGTSTPELLVSVEAALKGLGGIAIGNVVGSNIANILLILGISAVIGPLIAPFGSLRRDLAWMIAAALVCIPVFWSGFVGPIEGSALVAGIVIYLVLSLRQPKAAVPPDATPAPPLWMSAALAVLGLAAVLVGANLLVDSATDIARALGVSEAVIGLTIVAVGTSLPELATSVMAALRGQREIALGNVIGSNIFNIFAILGITALIAPIPVEPRFLAVDVPVMIAVSLVLVAVLWMKGGLGRVAGAGFLAAYTCYFAVMALI
jgi:cation:H+ antiporter